MILQDFHLLIAMLLITYIFRDGGIDIEYYESAIIQNAGNLNSDDTIYLVTDNDTRGNESNFPNITKGFHTQNKVSWNLTAAVFGIDDVATLNVTGKLTIDRDFLGNETITLWAGTANFNSVMICTNHVLPTNISWV